MAVGLILWSYVLAMVDGMLVFVLPEPQPSDLDLVSPP